MVTFLKQCHSWRWLPILVKCLICIYNATTANIIWNNSTDWLCKTEAFGLDMLRHLLLIVTSLIWYQNTYITHVLTFVKWFISETGLTYIPFLRWILKWEFTFIFNYCLAMRVDIHYCLPAECTSFLSMLGCSILYPARAYPCRRVDVKFQESLEE